MEKIIEIPDGYEARIEGNKVILDPKESEDERIRKDLITFICQFAPEHLKAQYVAYLEKQKEQKPAEWSEEDEKKRNGLIKGLENRMGFGWARDPFSREEYIAWLKSLRPQPHWKPSEEQMEALSFVKEYFKDVPSAFKENLSLIQLYDDLQKLM